MAVSRLCEIFPPTLSTRLSRARESKARSSCSRQLPTRRCLLNRDSILLELRSTGPRNQNCELVLIYRASCCREVACHLQKRFAHPISKFSRRSNGSSFGAASNCCYD